MKWAAEGMTESCGNSQEAEMRRNNNQQLCDSKPQATDARSQPHKAHEGAMAQTVRRRIIRACNTQIKTMSHLVRQTSCSPDAAVHIPHPENRYVRSKWCAMADRED